MQAYGLWNLNFYILPIYGKIFTFALHGECKSQARSCKKILSIGSFMSGLVASPALLVSSILTIGVIFVNGWTDAPNAIATCISTRALSPRPAIILAAIFNLLGVYVMTLINSTVAMTIYNMVDFGENSQQALVALCAALTAIVLWSVVAWYFGIPTSESHALIAGLSGAAIALQGGLGGVNFSEWIKVLYGLFFSTVLGFVMGFFSNRLIEFLFKKTDRRRTGPFFIWAQIVASAAMAFMHGAQDGQKFIGVFLLGINLASGVATGTAMQIPLWLMFLCALVMGVGTSVGGYRIIKSVGMDMVKLNAQQGFASDAAGAGCLLVSSLTGIPVSTTHTKTTAIMGVGASRRVRSVNWSVVKELVLTWILTFPGCGLIGYLMARLFLRIF